MSVLRLLLILLSHRMSVLRLLLILLSHLCSQDLLRLERNTYYKALCTHAITLCKACERQYRDTLNLLIRLFRYLQSIL